MTAKEWLIDKYPWMKDTWGKLGASDDWVAQQMREYSEYVMKQTGGVSTDSGKNVRVIDLAKYGFKELDNSDGKIFEYPESGLRVHFNGELYTFYSDYFSDCNSVTIHVYMIKLNDEKDFEFICRSVRDVKDDLILAGCSWIKTVMF